MEKEIKKNRASSQKILDNPSHGRRLKQWPCKLNLVPVGAPYLDGADLLIIADCAAFAAPFLYAELMDGAVTLTVCPRLEGDGARDKLVKLLASTSPRSIRTVRMETALCDNLGEWVGEAVRESGKDIPIESVILTTEGKIIR